MLRAFLLRTSFAVAATSVVILPPAPAFAQDDDGERPAKRKSKKDRLKKVDPARLKRPKAAKGERAPKKSSGKSKRRRKGRKGRKGADGRDDAKASARAAAKASAREDARRNAAAAAAAAQAEAKAQAEREQHARYLGQIERLEQIALATKDAELSAQVARLRDKESRRHQLALQGGAP